MHHPTDRIAHTTTFVTPVVKHWLKREIAQWVHPMSERSYHGATSRSSQKPPNKNGTYPGRYTQVHLEPFRRRLVLGAPAQFVRQVNPGVLLVAAPVPLLGVHGRRRDLPVLDRACYHAQWTVGCTHWNKQYTRYNTIRLINDLRN